MVRCIPEQIVWHALKRGAQAARIKSVCAAMLLVVVTASVIKYIGQTR